LPRLRDSDQIGDMSGLKTKALLASLFITLVTLSLHGEPARWVFEGVVVTVDPALAPELKSGWVLSGSFLLDPLEMEESRPLSESRDGRLEGGVSEAELTLDLYYQIRFEAFQVPGMVGFDYRDNDPEADHRDLLRWFIPLSGEMQSGEWRSTWLEVWLFDPAGKMLKALPPPVPPAGFAWDSSWFRLTFVNESAETAFLEGSFEIFAPLDAVEAMNPQEDLSAIIEDLGNRLIDRDQTISSLSTELAQANERISGLRQMVDLLVEERERLEEETAALGEKAALADPEVVDRLAALEAEKALLETELVRASAESDFLRSDMRSTETQRQQLAIEVEDLRLLLTQAERELESLRKVAARRTLPPGPPEASRQVEERSVSPRTPEGSDAKRSGFFTPANTERRIRPPKFR